MQLRRQARSQVQLGNEGGAGAPRSSAGTRSPNGGTHSPNGGAHSRNAGRHSRNAGRHSLNAGRHFRNAGLVSTNGGTHSSNGGTHFFNGGMHFSNGGMHFSNGGMPSGNDGMPSLVNGMHSGFQPPPFFAEPTQTREHFAHFALLFLETFATNCKNSIFLLKALMVSITFRSGAAAIGGARRKKSNKSEHPPMPFYDQATPIFFDTGQRYDETDSQPANPRRQKQMNTIRRNWNSFNIIDRITFTGNVVECCQTNTAIPAPNPPYTALTASYNAAKAANDHVMDLENQLKAARADRTEKVDAMIADLAAMAGHVEGATGGNIALMLTTGFEVTGVTAPPPATAPIAPVMNLVLTAGDHDGEVDATWAPVVGTRLYQTQTTTNPTDPALWHDYGVPQSRSSLVLMGLASGVRIWVRVRSLGAGDKIPGAWSDPSTKMVP